MNSKFSRSVEWMPAGNAVKVPVAANLSEPLLLISEHRHIKMFMFEI